MSTRGSKAKKRSDYLNWAKTCSQARFNLVSSGLTNVAMAEWPAHFEELEITGSDAYGYEPLQERIARHTGTTRECVVAATGTSMANHLAMAALLNPGDEVLIEEPTYGPLLDVAHYLGARVKRLPRRFKDEFAITPTELEKAITRETRLIVLSNLHNPSGALLKAETVRAFGELAARIGAHVIMDEVYLETLFDEAAPFAFAIGETLARGDDNPYIVTNSLTKTYGLSGLRCGWILASPELAHRMWLLHDLFGVNAAHPAERLSVMAFDYLHRFRARAQALLSANRALLDSFLDSRGDLECFRPPAGTLVFPRLIHGDAEAFCRLLREKYETTVAPGSFFEMPQHFRIGIGGDTVQLRAGLERLSTALDEFRK